MTKLSAVAVVTLVTWPLYAAAAPSAKQLARTIEAEGQRYDLARKMITDGAIRPLLLARTAHFGVALGLSWEHHSANVMTLHGGVAKAERISYHTFGIGLRAGIGSKAASWAKHGEAHSTEAASARIARTAIDAAAQGWSALPMGARNLAFPELLPPRGPALTFRTAPKTRATTPWFPAAVDGKRTGLLEAIDQGTNAVANARAALEAGDTRLANMYVRSFAGYEAMVKDRMRTIESIEASGSMK